MNILTVHFSKQLRWLSYNSIDIIRRYNHASNDLFETATTMQSKKFPDYKIIYLFPYTLPCQVFNALKRNQTIGVGLCIPITTSLELLQLISATENLCFTACNTLFALTLHTIGYLCNNLVGTIYIKNKDDSENQDMIISYINYWGRRIDLKTTVNDIIPFSENYMNANRFSHKTLSIKSSKISLTVDVKHGKIMEEATFSNIFE